MIVSREQCLKERSQDNDDDNGGGDDLMRLWLEAATLNKDQDKDDN